MALDVIPFVKKSPQTNAMSANDNLILLVAWLLISNIQVLLICRFTGG